MNSIRRRRGRPRVRSVNFRSFAWVLFREAALRVLAPDVSKPYAWEDWRRHLVRADGARIRLLVFKVLQLYPSRRYF